MNRLRNHLTLNEIERRYQSCQEPVETRRWQLLLQVAHSQTIREAAATLALDYDYALAIIRRYNQFGPNTLKSYRKISRTQKQHP